MRKFSLHLGFAVLAISISAWGAEGLTALRSPYGPTETMNRLAAIVEQKGMTVLGRIDHSARAVKVGMSLRPTEVLIFGNPRVGTAFMQCAQTVGIDLPMKALVWEDASGQVWLGYNDISFIAKRHEASECPVIENLTKALAGFAKSAVAQ